MKVTANEAETYSAQELAFWELDMEAPGEFGVRGTPPPMVYDLEERTALFGEKIILLAKRISRGPDNNCLIDQLVGAGTSVGANYCEADDGVSRADFKTPHRHLPKRSARNEILPPHGCYRRTHLKAHRSRTVERSALAPSHF